jgi:hypothetical protein
MTVPVSDPAALRRLAALLAPALARVDKQKAATPAKVTARKDRDATSTDRSAA